MPKPQNKIELLELGQKNFIRLTDLVDSCTEADLKKEFPKELLNRNLTDVLAHVHHWHTLMLSWYLIGMKGGKPNMPAEGYTWKQLPALNLKIRSTYQFQKHADIVPLLLRSYTDVRQLIQNHTYEELFEKKKYHWTGSTSLAAYFISNTSSHYDWAYKLIKKSLK